MTHTKKQNGFTIVELLVVIVVIGILAAIVIVAYNGIQARAQQKYFLTSATQVIKKAEAYNALNSNYPSYPHGTQTDFSLYDPTPSPTTKLSGGMMIFFYDEAGNGGIPLTTSSPYNYPDVILPVAQGTFNGVPQQTYVAGQCTGGKGFKVLYPDTVAKVNVMLTTGTGC